MRFLTLLLLAAALGVPLAAQHAPAESLKQAAIRRLLVLQRTDSLMLMGMERAFAEGEANREVPAGFMDALRLRMRRDIGQFVERLVPIYDSLYTAAEVDELTRFYQTRLGQRLVETQAPLSEAIMLQGQRWGMEMAGQVMVELSREPGRAP